MTNTYVIYDKATKQCIGPCKAMCVNWFVMERQIKYVEMPELVSEVAIVDPNGAVIVAHAILVEYKRNKNTTEFHIVPKSEYENSISVNRTI